MSDKIHIRNLKMQTIVGTRPDERLAPREVILNIILECDMRPAAKHDDLTLAINYSEVHDRLIALGAKSQFFLIETLADAIAELCLTFSRVNAVTVTVDKPGALNQAESVAVEITRSKSSIR